jgi:hypothetical protein
MSIHVIHVNSCHVTLDFSGNSVKWAVSRRVKWKGGREGGVKYVFLGLRRQLRCLAEGKIRLK